MAYSSQMPYNYARTAGDPTEQDAQLGASQPANQGGGPAPLQPNDPQQSQGQQRQLTAQSGTSSSQPVAPPRTFAQMQAEGYARPPMPAPAMTPSSGLGISAQPTNAAGQSMIPGTQSIASPGILGHQYVPGSNNGLIDLGGGNVAPAVNGQSTLTNLGTPAGVSLNAQGYPVWTATGQPWSGQDQQNMLAGLISSAPASGGQGLATGTPSPSGSAGGVGTPSSGVGATIAQLTGQSAGSPSGSMGTSAGGSPAGAQYLQNGQYYGAGGPPTDILSMLTGGAAGQGAGGQVQSATQQAALNQLTNPSPYGSADVKNLYNWLGGNIQDQFTQGQRAIGEDMARRGLGTSTLHAGALNDLNIGTRSAQESMAQNLAQNYAQTLGGYQANAINQGNTVGSTAQNNQQNWLSQLMGYGQQGFQNDLATNQVNQNAQNSYQDYVLKLLGLGYGG